MRYRSLFEEDKEHDTDTLAHEILSGSIEYRGLKDKSAESPYYHYESHGDHRDEIHRNLTSVGWGHKKGSPYENDSHHHSTYVHPSSGAAIRVSLEKDPVDPITYTRFYRDAF